MVIKTKNGNLENCVQGTKQSFISQIKLHTAEKLAERWVDNYNNPESDIMVCMIIYLFTYTFSTYNFILMLIGMR